MRKPVFLTTCFKEVASLHPPIDVFIGKYDITYLLADCHCVTSDDVMTFNSATVTAAVGFYLKLLNSSIAL